MPNTKTPVRLTNSAIFAGTITVGTTAVALTPDIEITEILVQADLQNQGTLYVGNATIQPIELQAAGAISISIDKIGKVFVMGDCAGQVANWIAVGR